MSYIWYASYGSNLMEERFLCYIKGGKPLGSQLFEKGARNKSDPLKSTMFTLSHRLYFAKDKSKWGRGGVAFIENEPNVHVTTYSKAYLITTEQFTDIVAQENGLSSLHIDYHSFYKKGFLDIVDGWYGRLLSIGEIDNIPVATFTSPEDLDLSQRYPPAQPYVAVILNGLQELGLTLEESISYLKNHYPGH